ncbi:MAG: protein tyrosine/serine phosphatase [Phenylobacterium sp.]|nr:protein tyrosine/serine phosphatase [Phenylobacterium sp.]
MGRHISFEGIDNFRDFGDYAAGPGRLRTGILFRSAHHASATDSDLEQLAGLGVSVIVDLRRSSEREREPSRRWSACAARVIESNLGQGEPGDWSAFIAAGDLSEAACRGYMLDFYRAIPFVPRHLELYAGYFAALSEADGAVVVHCAAGKDRTGVLCALTHHLAGVHEDDLIQDYLLTNRAQRLEARLPGIREAIARTTGREPAEEGLRAMLSVSPEFLAAALAEIRARHGSVEGYLEQALGVTPAVCDRIRQRLLD